MPAEFPNLPMPQVEARVDRCIDGLTTIQKKVDNAVRKALKAKKSSEKAKSITLHWYKIGDKAKAIEALQDAMVDVSDVQGEQSDAIKLLLEYQKNVAAGMQLLYALGVSNIAANRTVVREVKMRLENASEEEIGEMARNELRAVMAQLKVQLDIQEKQERLANAQKAVKATVQSHEENIDRLYERESEQDRLLLERVHADKEQDAEIQRQAEKDVEHDQRIDENRKDIDMLQKGVEAQEKAIEERSRIDREQDAELKRQAEKDQEHDEKIDANTRNIKENKRLIVSLKEALVKHRREITSVKTTTRDSATVSLGLSVLSLLISIVCMGLVIYSMVH